ncbi:uncharacterized protein APUU_50941S [Aspergillus puulaauensis]|uniref:Uncharacterized protein n=1 Tax=Aspergillus puulaauensis TaxID=1220207 RepID=A0A7R8AR36_9EURO|nr:uncharacterized protein APUU_50941S [Aspergillus puulaauensis]BCS26230.1 hypothetical protein APUU_50941S [Aspergillus puulaauensis]
MSTISQYHEIGSPAQPVSQPTGKPSRRFLAPVASHLALVGFLVMPLAFGDEPHVNKTVTVIVASILIGIAYSLSLFLVLLHFDERMHLIQSLLVPCLISNALALFNVLINILCRDLLPLGLLEILCLSFSAAFAFLYALCALWLYSRDVNEAVGNSNRGTILLTDEEMQRQQLRRLLEQNSSRKSLSPRAVQKTYRVNHPDRLNSFLPPPNEEGYFS